MSERAVALIDGEHYGPVVAEAIRSLSYEVVAAVLIGGTEKLRGGEDYGVPLAESLDEALSTYDPALVVDLSDEPVLGPVERMRVASVVLARGVRYEGADFRFEPPVLEPVATPTLAVTGTGKRVGKTAVTGHVARLLCESRKLVVVAMGRGGPPEPEVVEVRPTVDSLVALSRAGRHAASDHLETAVVVGVQTVGCRRCGGGLAGAVAVSNVREGVDVAVGLAPELVVLDGSGAALPPVAATRRVLVAGAHQDPALVTGYLNTYRLLLADLVVLTMGEDRARVEELRARVRGVLPDTAEVVATVLRPRPLEPVEGRRVAYFGTAPEAMFATISGHLAEAYGADVAGVSGNLARRALLADEAERADADVFVVELKAAAVDVVAEVALRRGIEVVLAANDVVPLEGEPDLDGALRRLADDAVQPAVVA